MGISGAGSARITEFNDGNLDQFLAANDLIRRGRTLADSAGIFRIVFENVHGAAELFTTIFPYRATIGAVAPFPTTMGRGFDIWLLEASVLDSVGGGAPFATLTVNNQKMGIGLDNSGAPVTTNNVHVISQWTTVAAIPGGFLLVNSASGLSTMKIGYRLPRSQGATGTGVSVTFGSSAAARTLTCTLMVGVFPIGMGQDVLV